MRVEVERDADLAVAQHLRDDLRVNATAHHQRSCCMSQIVETDTQAAALQQGLKRATEQVAGFDRSAQRIGEDKIAVIPGTTEPQALFALLDTVAA